MFQPAINDLVRPAWRGLLEIFVKSGPLSVGGITAQTGDSYMTVKTRCEELVKAGYLLRTRAGRPDLGRPEVLYSLAPKAGTLFPDGGEETILALLEHARGMFGDHAPEKLLFRHFEALAAGWKDHLAKIADPARRIAKFASLRCAAGHVCDVETDAGRVYCTDFHHPLARILERYPHAVGMEHRAVEHAVRLKAVRSERSAGRDRPPIVVFAFSIGPGEIS